MKWYSELYVSESIKDKANQIKRRIRRGAATPFVYVIALASNRANLLDIIPTWSLKQKAYPKQDIKVVGLAKGYQEALELVRVIVDETYQSTGGVDVRSYLREERRMR